MSGFQGPYTRYQTFAHWVAQLQSIRDMLLPYRDAENLPVPKPESISAPYARYNQVHDWLSRLMVLESAIQGCEEQMAEVLREESEIRAERDEMRVCPTCLQPIALCGVI